MDPHKASAIILVLCLVLIVFTFVLGVEVGKAVKLQTHPGYEGASSTSSASSASSTSGGPQSRGQPKDGSKKPA